MLFNNLDHFPVLLTKVVTPQPEDLAPSLNALVEFSRRARAANGYCANILFESPRGDPQLDAHGRRAFAQLIKQADPVMEERTVVSVAIISSSIRRGALTALLWIVGQKPPTVVRATIQGALDAVRSELERKGVRFPETLTLEAALRFDLESK